VNSGELPWRAWRTYRVYSSFFLLSSFLGFASEFLECSFAEMLAALRCTRMLIQRSTRGRDWNLYGGTDVVQAWKNCSGATVRGGACLVIGEWEGYKGSGN
jgi:hypothetical protein